MPVETTDLGRPKVGVLVVGYNSRPVIDACFSGLFQRPSRIEAEVLLVDNSCDGTIAYVNEHYPSVKAIESNVNLGFGGGNNHLAKMATGEYLLLLNPDMVIRDDAIGKILEFANQYPEAGAWGALTTNSEGLPDHGSYQEEPTLVRMWMSALGVPTKAKGDSLSCASGVVDVPILVGAFLLIRRDMWEELGGFDESFFLYSEEVDLCRRLREKGKKLLLDTSIRVFHDVGSGERYSYRRILARTRGTMHFIRKYHSFPYVVAFGIGVWVHAFVRSVAGTILALIGMNKRGGGLRKCFGPIALRPWEWWRGWAGYDRATGTFRRAE